MKNGFTLIELIAVIVILAILLLISVPLIGSLIDNAKRASLESSSRIIIKEIEKNIISNVNFSLDSINENTVKNIVNVDANNFLKLEAKKESEEIYISIDGKNKYDGYSICGTYQKLYINQPDMCSVSVGKTCNPLNSSDTNSKISEGYIPVANISDLYAINTNDIHVFAEGTEFEIETAGGLDKTYIQIKNIDLASEDNFIPIGYSEPRMEPTGNIKEYSPSNLLLKEKISASQMDSDPVGFIGEYYGNCYSIDNLNINQPELPVPMNAGLFSALNSGAFISNVTINNANIIGIINVGILAGEMVNGSIIENSRVNGKILSNNYEPYSIGGLVGTMTNSQIFFSSATVDIEIQTHDMGISIGGLVGLIEPEIEIGFFGENSLTFVENEVTLPSKISNSFANVDIISTDTECVGGLVGNDKDSDSKIENSYTKGLINSETGAGSFVGCSSGSINRTFSKVILINPNNGVDFENTHRFVNNYNDESQIVNSSYYIGEYLDDFAISITEEELLDVETFGDWDFSDTWHMAIDGPDLKELIYKSYGEDCFEFNEEYGAITGYDNYCPKEVIIPETINGITVKVIGDVSEMECTNSSYEKYSEDILYKNEGEYIDCETTGNSTLFKNMRITSLTLPGTIEYITSYAFSNNNIKSLVFPNSIGNIGKGAFANNLLESVSLPTNIKVIESSVFYNNRIANINFNSELTHIGENTFRSNYLQNIDLPENLLYIGPMSFAENQLQNLVIPNSTSELGAAAFSYNLLTSVVIPNGITRISSSLFNQNLLTSVVIPNSVTVIAENAFKNNMLTGIQIPSSVTYIGYAAFEYNRIPQGDLIIDNLDWNIHIGYGAFNSNGESGNDNITPVYIGSNEVCFTLDEENGIITGYHNSCSKDVVIPSTIRGITVKGIASDSTVSCVKHGQMYEVVPEPKYYQNDGRYKYCFLDDSSGLPFYNKQITSVVLPNTLEFIGQGVFDQNLITSLDLPSSLKHFSGFRGNKITSITIPNGVKTINDCALGENLLTNVVLPNTLEFIGMCSFRGNQLTSIELPSSLKQIGYQAFGANLLTSISLPEGLKYIDEDAFYTNQITSIVIPNSLEKLNGFRDNRISSLIIPNSVKEITYRAFESNDLTTLDIPSSVTKIENQAFASNEISTLNLSNGLTYLSGFKNNKITNVTIPNTLTEFGPYAFYSNLLTSINIPSSVTAIRDTAFQNNKITDLTIPDSVKTIEYQAFQNNLISNLNLPSNLTIIENNVFYSNRLTSVNIPASVTSIGTGAFGNNLLTSVIIPQNIETLTGFNNNKITSIVIPDSVKTIADGAFSYNLINSLTIPSNVTTLSGFSNNKLTSITIPDTVKTIGSNAFLGNMLTSVVIPYGVTSIGWSAFENNLLTSVTIPNTVTTINSYAFRTNSLTSVYIPNSVTTIGSNAFRYNNITNGNAKIDRNRYQITIGSSAFNNNGATKSTTISPTYLR